MSKKLKHGNLYEWALFIALGVSIWELWHWIGLFWFCVTLLLIAVVAAVVADD